MTAFSLLQLPLVAMEHVLCMMNPLELIDVSLASSRAKRSVKFFSKTKKKYSVVFDNRWHLISLCGDGTMWTLQMTTSEACTGQYLTKKYSENPLKDIMNWFDHAKEVLQCEINNVTLDLNYPSSENRQTVDWLAAQGSTMNYMEVLNSGEESGDDLKEDDLRYLMEKIQASKVFMLMVKKYKADFRMEIPGKPYHLHIENAQFIDYDQLLRLESPVIILRESILTSQEINRFLKSWMSCETHLELEAMQINISSRNAMNEIMNLPYERTNDPKLIEAFADYPHHFKITFDMITIQRCDGEKKVTGAFALSPDGSCCLFLLVH
uniref:F-box domain-containing protein n=1 Tax=Caenorhabditis tropicalis TaxID=1561998 RepID=A0A1I7UU11_9PELO